MSELISIFFGPLNKPACGYFLLLSIMFFIALLVLLFVQISYIIQNYKKLPFKMILFRIKVSKNGEDYCCAKHNPPQRQYILL